MRANPFYSSYRSLLLILGGFCLLSVGFWLPAHGQDSRLDIREFPVQTEARKELTREYARAHYGIDDWRLMDPSLIVVHYTGTDSDEYSLSVFAPDILSASRDEISAGGSVNVGVHYVIWRDGTIWSLLPETDMGRHAIGYNHVALGIEMTGSSGDRVTDAQIESCAALVADIAKRLPSIRYLCGHHEYMQEFRAHRSLYTTHLEGYAPTVKHDPGERVMALLRERLLSVYGVSLED